MRTLISNLQGQSVREKKRKRKFCHHLLSFMLFQTCMILCPQYVPHMKQAFSLKRTFVCLKSIGCTLSQSTHWKTMTCADSYGARNVLFLSPHLFFLPLLSGFLPIITSSRTPTHIFSFTYSTLLFSLTCNFSSLILASPSLELFFHPLIL